jgi:hypothetical protein
MTRARGLVSGVVAIVAGVGSVAPAAAADSMRGMLLEDVAGCALDELRRWSSAGRANRW